MTELSTGVSETRLKPALNAVTVIRTDTRGFSSRLKHIGWDEWFQKFDEHNLALLYQETTAGGERSSINKLVRRETAEGAEEYGHSKRVVLPQKRKKGSPSHGSPNERLRFTNELRPTKRLMRQSSKASRIRMPDGSQVPVVEYRNAKKFRERRRSINLAEYFDACE